MKLITLEYADVLLPLALEQTLTYYIPDEFRSKIVSGMRVVVQLGKAKLYTAIVVEVHSQKPEAYQAKPILTVIDNYPIVHPLHLDFWNWMSEYYMCSKGEVMNAALPSGLKLDSEMQLIHTGKEINYSQLSEREHLIMEALEMQPYLVMDDLVKILGIKTIQPYIRSLIDKGLIEAIQDLKDRYKPKYEIYIRLSDYADDEDHLKLIFDELIKAPKQMEALMYFIHLSSRYTQKIREVKKKDLLSNEKISSQSVKELIKKNVFEEVKKEVGRFVTEIGDGFPLKDLSEAQQTAYHQICTIHESKDVALLHGVTSSGKTEIYVKLIEFYINQGKQVLYLLPEIALTSQLIQRIHKYFPGKVGVYHSRFNENERVEVWNRVLKFKSDSDTRFQIVLGARSALFLPFTDLGLVIVDEEHENSFKQYDPEPRYNGRDAAIYLAHLHKAKVVLGSATPSVESYFNAGRGKYGLVELNQRYGNVKLPEVLTADINYEYKHRKMHGHYTSMLIEQMHSCLDRREQIILFQNRRGFSLILQCQTCGWTPQCKNCDVSLIYHKSMEQLRCHYCGYSTPMIEKCGACGNHTLHMKGFGTEKVELELEELFPKAKIARLDLDSTRKKHAYQEILQDFSDGSIDILVGTQMVTKGLDFDNVSLVGILNADNMLHFPDFRSHERAYQLMAQVSGRAGRRNKRGKVIIQTMNPYHAIIQQVIRNDYQSMYKQELLERRNFKYPPYYKLIQITLRNKEYAEAKETAFAYARLLKSVLGERVLGPEMPSVSRIKNQFIFSILIKAELGIDLPVVKKKMREYMHVLKKQPFAKRTRFVFDVDPY